MKEIELLKNQIDKLYAKDFDLEAWKQYTIVLLARIFGPDNQKIKQIEKIEYDFSSWALRDTSGKNSYMDTCKSLGKEIMTASIDELKAFGLPDQNDAKSGSLSIKIITDALENELKVSQYKELLSIIKSDDGEDAKAQKIKDKINTFGAATAESILSLILAHPGMKSVL